MPDECAVIAKGGGTHAAALTRGAEPMRVKMTQTRRGSEDGVTVALYQAGQEYEIGDALAQAFLASKSARPAPDQTDQTDKKAAKGPSQNK
jgi:hypothetical protein